MSFFFFFFLQSTARPFSRLENGDGEDGIAAPIFAKDAQTKREMMTYGLFISNPTCRIFQICLAYHEQLEHRRNF